MLTAEERKELIQKITAKRREISSIQTDLNAVNEKKEAFFAKKEELSKTISSLISEIKSSRIKRDELTKQVKSAKNERDTFNKAVRESVEKIKALEKERDAFLKKHNLKEDPTLLVKKIQSLEFKIETQPMSFEEEKKIMKKIKDLKKGLDQSKAVLDIVNKINELSKEIDQRKKTAQTSHKQIQNTARESQKKHEALIETSTHIDQLKTDEEAAFKNFIEQKKKFNELNNTLKGLLTEIKEMSSKLDEDKKTKKTKNEKSKKEALEQKKLSVEEKIKKKMKLTTEDLLAFQSTEYNS